MYILLAVLAVIVGICLFAFSNRIAKNSTVGIGIKIIGIILIVFGIIMAWLLLSGEIVLPLSRNKPIFLVAGVATMLLENERIKKKK